MKKYSVVYETKNKETLKKLYSIVAKDMTEEEAKNKVESFKCYLKKSKINNRWIDLEYNCFYSEQQGEIIPCVEVDSGVYITLGDATEITEDDFFIINH